MTERFELFTTLITQIYKNLQRIKNIEMNEFNMKGTHVMCIFFLSNHKEGLTVTELSRLCSEDKAAISRTIAELTESGYITSTSEKKYRAPLILSPKGEQIAGKINELINSAVAAGGNGLTEDERKIFYHSLKLISDNLSNYP